MIRRFAAAFAAITLAGSFAAVVAAQSSRPLTDQDVIEMARAGFGDSTILKYIRANDVDFDLSVSSMVLLKSAGVSQSLIEAMLAVAIEKKTGGATAILEEIARRSSGLPEEVAFYARQNGKLMAIEPEIVNWRSGGSGGIRSIAAGGVDKSSFGGTVSGPHSQLTAIWPPLNMVPLAIDFYILCPEGSSASDFQLLHLSPRGDHRELRGIAGSVPFSFDKVAPKTYKITLPNLSVGEYGFLLHGSDATANFASSGRIYTFRIIE